MTTRVRTGLVFSLALTLHAAAAHADEQQNLVDRARMTVDSFSEADEMTPLRRLMPRARAVLIVPQLLKAGFVVGGAGGSGVLVVRDQNTGDWSAPAFYTLGDASVGLQIGASASEVVLVVLTERGLDAILKNKIKLGGDVSVATGPVGVGAGAAATTNMSVDIVSFTRSKGLFAGLSLEGAVLESRGGWDQRYYGKAVTPTDVIQRRAISRGAIPLQRALRRIARRSDGDTSDPPGR